MSKAASRLQKVDHGMGMMGHQCRICLKDDYITGPIVHSPWCDHVWALIGLLEGSS